MAVTTSPEIRFNTIGSIFAGLKGESAPPEITGGAYLKLRLPQRWGLFTGLD